MPRNESGLKMVRTENKLRYRALRSIIAEMGGSLFGFFLLKGSQMAFQIPQGDGPPPHSIHLTKSSKREFSLDELIEDQIQGHFHTSQAQVIQKLWHRKRRWGNSQASKEPNVKIRGENVGFLIIGGLREI